MRPAPAPDAPLIKPALVAEASAAGFDGTRIAAPGAIPDAGPRLQQLIAEGRHGDMTWLAESAGRRGSPTTLWPAVRSVVMLAKSYAPAPGEDPLAILSERSRGAISCYARGRDYHDLVKSGLKQVASWLHRTTGAEVKVFVDTAPVMEKPLAAAAGLGWQGKHTNLVSREHGSWLFLGSIYTTLELAPDPPEADHCGSCRRCLDICPTGAFPSPYQLDPRRCISYLTIEHRGHIPPELRKPIGNRVFGCDDCLAVCPWNKFAAEAREQRFKARPESDNPPLAELIALDDAAFRRRFAGTPVKRTGRDRFVRNALIAAGNSGDQALVPEIERRLSDASPLVRAMAVWALARLAEGERVARLAALHVPAEGDSAVLAEWRQALSRVAPDQLPRIVEAR
jgi:epoxyqueuosine reductase